MSGTINPLTPLVPQEKEIQSEQVSKSSDDRDLRALLMTTTPGNFWAHCEAHGFVVMTTVSFVFGTGFDIDVKEQKECFL